MPIYIILMIIINVCACACVLFMSVCAFYGSFSHCYFFLMDRVLVINGVIVIVYNGRLAPSVLFIAHRVPGCVLRHLLLRAIFYLLRRCAALAAEPPKAPELQHNREAAGPDATHE